MGFLFGDADVRQEVKDFLAFDFQLPGQIVDSNLLLHPPCISPNSAKSSFEPHGFSGFYI